ncbi:MAG: FKBP-type peptidyl-prolyl cis-trans isomerase [Anaerolineae bacterium]|nr:FKBP-type peptidyl-prolyl cis-trans isomerase [Anaerolineae bacterium]
MSADKQFLEANASKEGVVTTASGLQYKVLTQGTGKRPSSANSEVEVHYEGRLINGKVFDSSYQRGEAITFFLNQVIAGWTEGVQLMPVGSVYELYIPSELGYGARGAAGVIPPNATLIFKVELLNVY